MWTIISYIAAVFTTISFLPQAIKIIINKNTKGISLYMYIVFNLGLAAWTLYGIGTHNYAIVLANSISLCFGLLIMIFKVVNIFKNGERP